MSVICDSFNGTWIFVEQVGKHADTEMTVTKEEISAILIISWTQEAWLPCRPQRKHQRAGEQTERSYGVEDFTVVSWEGTDKVSKLSSFGDGHFE